MKEKRARETERDAGKQREQTLIETLIDKIRFRESQKSDKADLSEQCLPIMEIS